MTTAFLSPSNAFICLQGIRSSLTSPSLLSSNKKGMSENKQRAAEKSAPGRLITESLKRNNNHRRHALRLIYIAELLSLLLLLWLFLLLVKTVETTHYGWHRVLRRCQIALVFSFAAIFVVSSLFMEVIKNAREFLPLACLFFDCLHVSCTLARHLIIW